MKKNNNETIYRDKKYNRVVKFLIDKPNATYPEKIRYINKLYMVSGSKASEILRNSEKIVKRLNDKEEK